MIGSSASESRGESSSSADLTLLSQSNDPELSSVDAMLESGDSSTEQRTALERELIPSDFVNYVGHAQSLNNAKRLSALQDHFKPDKLYHFPTHTEYRKQRSFRYCWLEQHDWLVYSPSQDGAYCKVCSFWQ